MNINILDKIKIGFAAMFGGVAGLVNALLDWFNDKVLAKLDKTQSELICKDVLAVLFCLQTILESRKATMRPAFVESFKAVIDAVNELAKALADCQIDSEELDAIVNRVKAAIDIFRNIK